MLLLHSLWLSSVFYKNAIIYYIATFRFGKASTKIGIELVREM